MISKTGLMLVLLISVLLFGCTQTTTAVPSANASASPFSNASSTPIAGAGLVSEVNGSSSGVAPMAVKSGDTVKVDYLGTTGGVVFDTSIEADAKKAGLKPRPFYEPLQFKVGSGQVVPGFDKAVLGMKVGDEKTVDLPPKEAYGEWNPEGVYQIPRTMFENGTVLKVGMNVVSPQGMPGVIVNVSDSQNVSIDFNHFLAGKTLTFKIILREITQ